MANITFIDGLMLKITFIDGLMISIIYIDGLGYIFPLLMGW